MASRQLRHVSLSGEHGGTTTSVRRSCGMSWDKPYRQQVWYGQLGHQPVQHCNKELTANNQTEKSKKRKNAP